jgi:hypothetical protein
LLQSLHRRRSRSGRWRPDLQSAPARRRCTQRPRSHRSNFPPTPQQAAATLQSLLPPGSTVTDVRSNLDKAGGAAVDIDVDGAHAVMADVQLIDIVTSPNW